MSITLALLPGDGIGPELCAATHKVLEGTDRAFGLGLEFQEEQIGFAALENSGTTLPDSALDAAKGSDGIVLGPVSHNGYPSVSEGGISPSGALRKALDLYANIQPCRTREGVVSAIGKSFDLVIYRENTEGFYADRNMASGPGEMLISAGERRQDANVINAGLHVLIALDAALSDPASRCVDLGGSLRTDDFGSAVIARLTNPRAGGPVRGAYA